MWQYIKKLLINSKYRYIMISFSFHRFGVTPEMVEPFLEDLTLEEALEKKRIFIVDLKILEGISTREGLQVSPSSRFVLQNFSCFNELNIQMYY